MSFVEKWVCGAGGRGAESAVTPSSISKHVHTHGEEPTSVGLVYLQLVGNDCAAACS